MRFSGTYNPNKLLCCEYISGTYPPFIVNYYMVYDYMHDSRTTGDGTQFMTIWDTLSEKQPCWKLNNPQGFSKRNPRMAIFI